MFIERAEGILHLRDLYQEAGIECSTQLALAEQLTRDGYPVSPSQISRMLQTVDWLLPCIPKALYGGLPLLAKLISLWLKARGQGADEGNVARLLVVWVEHSLYSALLVIFFAGVPFLNVDINTLTYDSQWTKQRGWSVVQPGDSGYAPFINELSGQSASVPMWWYFTHALSKGITSAAVAVLPCKPDLRQLRFEVQHTRLADPALAQELQDFVNDCYGPSRTRLKRLGSDISEEQSRELDWVGSSFYLSTPGYYDHDHSRAPHAAWPYDASRDDGLSDTGDGGYPACTITLSFPLRASSLTGPGNGTESITSSSIPESTLAKPPFASVFTSSVLYSSLNCEAVLLLARSGKARIIASTRRRML